MSEIRRCNVCKSFKKEAIQRQVSLRQNCDINYSDCAFRREIQEAIDKKTNIKMIRNKKEKQEFKVIRKQTICIIKK